MCLVNHDTEEPIETSRGENLLRQAQVFSRSEKTAVKKVLARLLQSDTPSDDYKDMIIEMYQALEYDLSIECDIMALEAEIRDKRRMQRVSKDYPAPN